MFPFEAFLMQADIIDSVGVLIGSLAGIIGVIGTIIAARVRKTAESQGRVLTEHEKKQIADAEFTQMIAQKVQEEMAKGKVTGRALYELATTPEQRQYIEKEVKPIVDTTNERIAVIQEQIPFFTRQLGVDVNQNPEVPRESTDTLKKINDLKRV